MPPLRWGLLGTARINRLLIPAIRSTGRSSVAAVASRTPARAAAYAAEWSIPVAHSSYDALVDDDLDVIYIPLPNSLHAAWTLRAMAAGKHVLCEKPLALSVAEIDTVSALARRHGRVVTEGFMYRHHAHTARVLSLLADGAIGEIRHITGAFTYMQSRTGDVRLEPTLGGGALWDVGCYPVSYAHLCAGAEAVSVVGSQRLGPSGVDETFAGTIDYANGVTAQVTAGFRAAYSTVMRLTGTAGVIDIDRPFRPDPADTIRLTRGGVVESIPTSGNAIFVDEIADMEDAALGVAPPRISLAESRTIVGALCALYESARVGRRIAIATAVPHNTAR